MIDGVPMVEYGNGVVVNPSSTTYVILYPLPDYIGDAELLYEDDVTQNLFLHRISGEVRMAYTQPDDVAGAVSLMPLGVNYDTITVNPPFASPWTFQSQEWANQPHWWKREYLPELVSAPSLVDHPWWTRVDIKPRRLTGVKYNQWPVLACRNRGEQTLIVTHYLKAWYS